MKIEVDIKKRYAFAIVGAILVLAGVIAFGGSNPGFVGHSSGEVEVTVGGVVKSLQKSIDEGTLSRLGGRKVTVDSSWTINVLDVSHESGESGSVSLSSSKPVVAMRIHDMYTAWGGVCSFALVDDDGVGYAAGYEGFGLLNPSLSITEGYNGGYWQTVYGGTVSPVTFNMDTPALKSDSYGGSYSSPAWEFIRENGLFPVVPGTTLNYMTLATAGQGRVSCKIDVLYGTYV